MELSKILSYCDHTLLSQTATFDEIKVIIDDAIKYGCASVCIPPALVKRASEYAGGRMKICTVIGFPNGYSTEAVKVFETREAVREGADEIDMVINVGLLKEGNLEALLSEINAVKREAGERIVKVIIETCFLTEEEKIAISGNDKARNRSEPRKRGIRICKRALSVLLQQSRRSGAQIRPRYAYYPQ